MSQQIRRSITTRLFALSAALALSCIPSLAQVTPLPFRPVDARYSQTLDRIVMVTSDPGQLHIYDPVSGNDSAVNLAKPALAVALSPDGRFAAVGHDHLVSFVDLSARIVRATYPVGFRADVVVLNESELDAFSSTDPSNGYIQALTGPANGTYAFQLTTSGALLNARTWAIYFIGPNDNGLGTLSLSSNISSTSPRNEPLGFTKPASGKIWAAADGSRIYTSCPVVFSALSNSLSATPYLATLPGLPHLEAAADHPSALNLAVIPDAATSSQCQTIPQSDDHLLLYDKQYYRQTGQLALTPFSAQGGNFPAHGRFVFYNANGTKLFVISQADAAAKLSNDFAVQTFDFLSPATCAPAPSSSTFNMPSTGGLLSIDLTAQASCQYHSASSSPWAQIISSEFGSGSQALKVIIRPNPSPVTRTATLIVGLQQIVISQSPAAGFSPFMPLSFRIAAADYSKLLDRAILAAASPDELHIYDASTGADRIIPLPRTPTSVAVSPDGSYAAVGHSDWISLVNLNTGIVESTRPAGGDVAAVAIPNPGLIYFIRRENNAQNTLASLNESNGQITSITSTTGTSLRLNAAGTVLYWEGSFLSLKPSSNPETFVPLCGNLWLADDDSEALSACGQMVSLPSQPGDHASNLGPLQNSPPVPLTSAADSSILKTTVVIPHTSSPISPAQPDDTQALLYNDTDRTLVSQTALPGITAAGQTYASHGRYTFWNKAADRLIVFTQADPSASLASDWSVAVFAPSLNRPDCTVSPVLSSLAIGAQGNVAFIPVSAADGCAWTAKSSASWLAVSSGAFGVGNGALTYAASVNLTASARTGTITLNDKLITITQPASDGSVTLSPSSASAPASGASGVIFVSASSSSFVWSITRVPSWITINSGLSGTGNGSVRYTVAPAPSTASRTDTFYVGDQPFSITQQGANVSVTLTKTQFAQPFDTATINIASDSTAVLWNPAANANWVHFYPEANQNSGSGKFTMTVDFNDSLTPRSATIIVAGKSLTITQAGITLELTPKGAQFGPQGGSGIVTISFPVTLNAVSNASWIKITGAGTSTALTYSVDPYSGGPPRAGSLTIGGLAFNVLQTGTDPIGYNFVPMAPCRYRRLGFNANGAANISFADGFPCRISPTAVAYSLNITAIPHGKLDFFTLWAAGKPIPEVSTLNSYDGRVVANAAIVPAGQYGQISAYATDRTDIIIDINGYFDAVSPEGLSFYPLTPCRTVDTRNADMALGPPGAFSGSRDFPIASSTCQPPASTKAYSLNVTAVPVAPLGFLTLWPTGQSMPQTSTLNSYDGGVVANAALTLAGTNGSLSAYAAGITDVLMDLNGVFAPSGSIPGATGLKFYPMTPCRVADTRNPPGPLGAPSLMANAVRPFAIVGACGVPANAQAFAFNVTVVPKNGSLHFLTLWPAGQPRPEASTLNSYQGKVLANAAIVPAGTNGAINAFATDDTEFILDVNGYFAP